MTVSRRRTTFVRRLSTRRCARRDRVLIATAPVGQRIRSGDRGAELLQDAGAPDDLQHRAVPGAAAPGRRSRTQQQAITTQATDPERNFIGFHLCATGDDGCAGDVRLYDWEKRATGSWSRCSSPRAAARRSPGHVWATKTGPVEAARHRHHEWFGPGARAALLVRGADAREGGLRRADLRPAGPGTVGRARRGARRERGLAGADRRPPVLRRHRGRARLLLLHTEERLQAARRAATAARATPPSRTAASPLG